MLGALVELIASRTADLVVERLQAAQRAPANDPMPTGLVDKRTAARAISVSEPTLDRFTREGAPMHVVGCRRRFDVAELRAWVEARGRKPTTVPTATKAEGDVDVDVDVDDVLAGSGLRRA